MRAGQDPWLPKNNGFRPRGVNEVGMNMRVSELIDPVTHEWKMDVVRAAFTDEDATTIEAIPLPRLDMGDKWYGITQAMEYIR